MRKNVSLNLDSYPLKYPDTKKGFLKREIDESIVTYIDGIADKNGSANVNIDDLVSCINQLEIVSNDIIYDHLRRLIKNGILAHGNPAQPLSFYELYTVTNQIPAYLAKSHYQNLVPLFDSEFNEIGLNMQILSRVKRRYKQAKSQMNWGKTLTQTIYWELAMLRGKVRLKIADKE